MLVVVVPGDQDAERVVGEGVADESGEARPDAAVVLVHIFRDVAAQLEAGVVERIGELDVESRAERPRGQGRVRSLQHLNLAHPVGAQGTEIEVLPEARSDLAPIAEDLVELGPEAAHRDAGDLAGRGRRAGGGHEVDRAAVHGDTGDTRDRRADRGIRELADILGGDRVHHADRGLLDVEAPLQGCPDAGHRDFLQRLASRSPGRSGRRLRAVLRDNRCGEGAQGQRRHASQNGAHDTADSIVGNCTLH